MALIETIDGRNI